MANVYTYASQAQVRQQLANRLYDPLQIFWAPAELNLYIYESLRTWQALTSYWKNDFIFSARQNVTWYDLTDATNLPNTLRSLTVTDRQLYTLIQYHLLEATAWNPWTGVSAQFTPDDLLQAVQRRRDEILSLTGCYYTRRLVPAVPGRILLPDTVIDIRRIAYVPAIGSPSVLWPEDTWAEQAFQPNYIQLPSGTPATYLQTTQPPISFDTDIAPGFGGQYEVLSIEAGAALSVGAASTFTIPDDWTHIIKWGALADLLGRESNAKDSLRATYCEQRYQMGIKLLRTAAAMLAIRIANLSTSLQIDSVREADLYTTSWQAQPPGPPSSIHYAGLNLVAVDPIPDAGAYSLMATVVQNAPLPVLDTDPVQVARDDLDAILDYAQHLAAFKMGGAEFTSTVPLLQCFLQQAAVYGLKLAEIAEYARELYRLAQGEEDFHPTRAPEGAS